MFMYVSLQSEFSGRPFDTWGGGQGYGFLHDQTFSTHSLNVQCFRPYQNQTFYLNCRTQNSFFRYLFHLILGTPF